MSGTLDFFRKAGLAKLGDIGDNLTSWYAQFDPETASAAEIAQLGDRANALAHRIAEIQGKLEHDQHAVETLNSKLTRDKQAAQILGGRLKAAQTAESVDSAMVTQLTAQITPILTEIETLGGEDGTGNKDGGLFDAKQTMQADTDDMAQFRAAHTKAINDWTTARSRLDHARSDMERAAQQKQDAMARQAQAQRDAGLLHSAAAGGIALTAMDRRAEQLRTEARAATIQADGLRHAGGADTASIVDSVLTEAPPDKSSAALDRLARLTGG